MNPFDSHSPLRSPKLLKWTGSLALVCLLMTPRAASADPDLDFAKAFFVMEVVFPDLRLERNDRGGFGVLLSWPIPLEVFETSDGLASFDVFGEPQLRITNLDLRLAGGMRGNWNVFGLLGGLDDTGLIAELGGVYDDFPGVFVGGGVGARPQSGIGVGLVYRRVWTLNESTPHRHDFSIDFRAYF